MSTAGSSTGAVLSRLGRVGLMHTEIAGGLLRWVVLLFATILLMLLSGLVLLDPASAMVAR